MDTQRKIDALHDAITDCFIAVQALRVLIEGMEEKAKAASMVLDIRLRVERLGMRHSNVFINPTELTRRVG